MNLPHTFINCELAFCNTSQVGRRQYILEQKAARGQLRGRSVPSQMLLQSAVTKVVLALV